MRPRAEALRTRSALGQGSYRCPGAGATGRTKDRPWGHGRSERKEDGPRGQPCWAGTTVPTSQTPVAREAH